MNALATLVAALLTVSSVLGASAGGSPATDGDRPVSSAVSGAEDPRPGSATAGCGRDTVACQLPVPATDCEPRVGVHCIGAVADAALWRWVLEHRPMPGHRAVLDVVDGRVLVVGYAHGYGEPSVEVDQVERDHHVSITLAFDFHREPSLEADDVQPPVVAYGRVLVELDEPLGDRVVDVWTTYTPRPGA